MSQRSADLYLVDILDAAGAIARLVQGVSFEDFVGQAVRRDAVMWNLTMLGAASTRLPADLMAELADIPWNQIRGFRNWVIHGYTTLRWPIVWQIAANEVPQLRDGAESLLAKHYPETHRRRTERHATALPDEAP